MLRAAAAGTWKNTIHKQFIYLDPAAAFLTYFSNRSLLVVVVLSMSDECEYLTHLKFPCSGYSIAYIFLEEVSIEEVEQMSVLQNFDLEALDGRRIYDGSIRKFDMFSSILETHLSWWPLLLYFLYCRSISISCRIL